MKSDEPILDISSLIDVCFLLLIYFMVTATIQPRESDIGLQLPGPPKGSAESVDTAMLIQVQADGSILYNEEALDLSAIGPKRELPKLRQRLELYKLGVEAAGSQAIVQLAADGNAPQQTVIDVMNCLIEVNIRNVAFTDTTN